VVKEMVGKSRVGRKSTRPFPGGEGPRKEEDGRPGGTAYLL